jgi:hypothetical protein
MLIFSYCVGIIVEWNWAQSFKTTKQLTRNKENRTENYLVRGKGSTLFPKKSTGFRSGCMCGGFGQDVCFDISYFVTIWWN